ncbi:MAG: ABC transporter substrate-binding protein [Methylococcales bacterium]
MKKLQYTHGCLYLMFIAVFFSSQACADQELSAPQLVIEATSTQLKERIGLQTYQGNLTETMRIVEEVLRPHVDQHRISALALGKFWKTATPQQRADFEKEFKSTMVRLYSTAYASYKDWSIDYLPLRLKADDKKTIVKIKVNRSGGQPVAISYRMVNRAGQWKVYDIIIEGISLVTNYRNQFKGIIVDGGGSVQALIDHLAKKNRAALKRINAPAPS